MNGKWQQANLLLCPKLLDHRTGIDTGFGLLHRKFPHIAELAPGTLVEIGTLEPKGPPLDWRRSEASVLPGLCEELSGNLIRREGKDLAFISTAGEKISVPSKLAKEFSVGKRYDGSCLAIRRTNRQGLTGWRAVNLIVQEVEPADESLS